jgi:hypothetical protein
MFLLVKMPVGSTPEVSHTHPQANHIGFPLSGEVVRDDGSIMSFGEGNYSFNYYPKGSAHGPPEGSKMQITKEAIVLQYFDGTPTKLIEGETTELPLE